MKRKRFSTTSEPCNTATLYVRVACDIASRIKRGDLQPGDRLPPILDLCRDYSVSNITIRGALRHLTAAGLLETRPRSGVFVRENRPPAHELRGERVIAFIATAIQNPFFSDIIHGVEEECHAAGYRLMVANSNNEVEREVHHLQELSRQVAGMIIAPVTGYAHQQEYSALQRLGIPFVFVDRRVEKLQAPLVASDNARGAYEAIRHLLEIGRREIVVLSGPHTTSLEERVKGARQAMNEAGLKLPAARVLTATRDDEAAAYTTLKSWLKKNAGLAPLGVFALNDLYARAAYIALREANLEIPRAAAVVGFDDISAVFLQPPMTTVRQDAAAMGAQAARVLMQVISGTYSADAREVRLAPRLIIRNSTDAGSEFCAAEHLSKRERKLKPIGASRPKAVPV